MAFCHGQGSQGGSHCCWVDGVVCPHYMTGAAARSWVEGAFSGGARNRARDQVQGVAHACTIAVRLLANNPSFASNRGAFEQAWDNDPAYVADVRPAWAALEERTGRAAGSFQCSSWQGENGAQCCFAEPPTTNQAKAANLSTTAVSVRSARAL